MHPPSAARRLSALIATILGAAGLATAAAEPSGGHGHPAAASAATPSASRAASAAATRPAIEVPAVLERRDPLEVVKERLAKRLGAVPLPGGEPNVVRLTPPPPGAVSGVVASPAPTPPERVAHEPDASPAMRHAVPNARRPVAAHASTKSGPPRRWDYAGAVTGPQGWSHLDPAFAACGSGVRQSPIDLRDGIRVDLDPIRFDYQPGAFRVLDTGRTVQVNVAPGSAIEVGGRRYALVQFHFHRPSEVRIDGRQFAMEAHLVHRSTDGRLAVVAVLLEAGPAQPLVQAVWNNLPLEKGEEAAARAPLDPGDLLPADRRYYTTMGSLTEPPCTEGVLWLVLKQPVGITAAQEAVFAHLYPMNARPLQAAAGRLVKESN